MARQRVKIQSYLAKAVINLAEIGTDSFEAVILPANAEILSVNVEVLEATAAGKTINVGLDSEDAFFTSALDVATKGANYNSSKVTMTNTSGVVTVKASAVCAKGQIALRVFYFLPSEQMTEF